MSHLISDVVRYAVTSTSGNRPHNSVDLNEAWGAATEAVRTEIESTGAQVAAAGLPRVPGDLSQLTEVFSQLLGNSLKFRTPGIVPQISVSASAGSTTSEWQITFRDNGEGFSPEYQERVFGLMK